MKAKWNIMSFEDAAIGVISPRNCRDFVLRNADNSKCHEIIKRLYKDEPKKKSHPYFSFTTPIEIDIENFDDFLYKLERNMSLENSNFYLQLDWKGFVDYLKESQSFLFLGPKKFINYYMPPPEVFTYFNEENGFRIEYFKQVLRKIRLPSDIENYIKLILND